jgi:DNA-directed RNA polymerase subunit RPC12/RpoP
MRQADDRVTVNPHVLLQPVSAGRLSGAARITVRSNPGPPMSLANMRLNGVRMVTASCANCGHQADVNVDALPETLTVPQVATRLRCSQCGGKRVLIRPAWHTGTRRHAVTPPPPQPRPMRPVTEVGRTQGSVSANLKMTWL